MITSMTNETIKQLVKLKQKKYRDRIGCYLIEGEHLVEEALKANLVQTLISTKPLDIEGFDILLVSEEVMKKLAFTKQPQSLMAKCTMVKEQVVVNTNRYLILDDLQDPGNVGTLIRTALAFGIKQIILSPTSVDIYNDKVLRSMQGANFHLSCIYQPLEQIIPILQKQGVYVVGSALENAVTIDDVERQSKMAYIVGNEGKGMRGDIMDLCDALAYIPITTMESLNVAIAGSIMMYHFK